MIEDDEYTYYRQQANPEDQFPITPELQKFMDDNASKTLLAMTISEELGLNDFGKA